jgi:hypothetical protein
MTHRMRVTLETEPKGEKVVALAPYWLGLARGAATEAAAIERLLCEEVRHRRVNPLFEASDRLAALHLPSLSEGGVEIEAARVIQRNTK